MSFTNQTVGKTVENLESLLETEYTLTVSGWTLGLLSAGYFALFVGYFTLYFWACSNRNMVLRLQKAYSDLKRTRPRKLCKVYDELENVRANLAIGLQVLTNFAETASYEPEDVETHLDDLDDVLTYCRAILPQLKGDRDFYRKMIDSVALRSREIHLENIRDTESESSMEDREKMEDVEPTEEMEVAENYQNYQNDRDSPSSRTRSKVKNH